MKKEKKKKRVTVLPDLGTVVVVFVRGGAECSALVRREICG